VFPPQFRREPAPLLIARYLEARAWIAVLAARPPVRLPALAALPLRGLRFIR
jgi:hypothetical protein